ncbi:MAG: hypothetical protein ACLS9G_00060 [Akkermansia sp.]
MSETQTSCSRQLSAPRRSRLLPPFVMGIHSLIEIRVIAMFVMAALFWILEPILSGPT